MNLKNIGAGKIFETLWSQEQSQPQQTVRPRSARYTHNNQKEPGGVSTAASSEQSTDFC